MMFYSKANNGFYNNSIHGTNLPADAVEVTDAEYTALFVGQSTGSTIVADSQGKPKLQAPPAPTFASTKTAKLAALATKRYEVETSGVTVGGATIMTDRESQSTVTSAWVRVQQQPDAIIDWKGANGWAQIGKAEVEAVAAAVGTHVQACFTAEKNHAVAIEALTTIAAINAYDITAGW